MKVQLVVVQGKPEGMVIPLAGARYKIGRGEGCQLRPNSDLVSREHAEFVKGDDSVQVQDLGSRNGTEVNGKRLPAKQPVTLKSGDLIKVGTLTFAIAIEGLPNSKPAGATGGSGRKPSLDDVSGAEIDAWLVSDESRPTPDRPSGVYGGDTITLPTFKDQTREKPKAAAPVAATPPAPRPAPAPVVATAPVPPPQPAVPPPPAPAPVAVAPPVPAPVAVAPPVPAPVAVAPPVPEPVPVVAPAPPPAAAPATQATVEAPYFNPIFNFLSNSPDQPDLEPAAEEGGVEEVEKGDGFMDLSSFQDDDEEESGASGVAPVPEEFVDESNPFYVKKPVEAPAAAKSSQDSSSAAGDILRKLMDRKRAK